jgi:kanosamine 6-kinase
VPGAAPEQQEGRGISYLGIDVGGTKVSLLAAPQPGRDQGISRDEDTFCWSAGSDVDQDLELLDERARLLLGHHCDALKGIGVAMPATCDAAGVVRTWPGRPSWTGLDLAASLRRLFPGIPVLVADDGDLAALAEARAAQCGDLLYLGVGTGIGGGIVHGGRPWPGLARGSAEVGHVIVDRTGPRCDCGRVGCVQATASGPATLRRAADLSGMEVGPGELAGAVREEKDWALAAIGESAAALARVVVGLGEVAHPELVVIGGGFAAGIRGFTAMIGEHVLRLARAGSDPAPIRPAVFGPRSSLHGAILLVSEALP